MILPPSPAPCVSCPYRRDVPSGVWSEDEYAKLPPYDGETGEQPASAFMCHQQDDRLCAGWVGCHDMEESLGIRFAVLTGGLAADDLDAVFDYECSVPLWASGQEAHDHGMREVLAPGPDAAKTIKRLRGKLGL